MLSRLVTTVLPIFLLLTACAPAPAAPAAGVSTTVDMPRLTVAAAADLIPAFTEVGALFTQQTGIGVDFSFGSTGQLAQQIQQGAPIDLFAAANQSFIDQLEQAGRIIPDSRAIYAVGRLTLWTRSEGSLNLTGLADLTNPAITHIAIANPEHAPYGVAAREALQRAGLWEELQPKLVFGENVAQTLQFASSGNADVAIVALSLSVQGEGGRWLLLAEELHNPLIQALAVIEGTAHEAEARRFSAFVNSEEGRTILRRYGFVLPGEEPFTTDD